LPVNKFFIFAIISIPKKYCNPLIIIKTINKAITRTVMAKDPEFENSPEFISYEDEEEDDTFPPKDINIIMYIIIIIIRMINTVGLDNMSLI
jgi:hypothetical protein